ncbi:MAG: hypothetical protein SFY69_07405 [Planctomycetota bacterium]|nr:hypothetical protein [Planctomycetota bacterium]
MNTTRCMSVVSRAPRGAVSALVLWAACGLAIGEPEIMIVSRDGAAPTYRVFTGPGPGSVSSPLGAGQRVAVRDLNNDGIDDIVVASGPGSPGQIAILSGDRTRPPLTVSVNPSFTGGFTVAIGNHAGDAAPEIVLGQETGGGQFLVLSNTGVLQFGVTPYSGYTGGVRVAAGDVTGDGRAEIIAAPTVASPTRPVRVYAADTGQILANLFPFGNGFTGGVTVATGDVNGDGTGELVVSQLGVTGDATTGAPVRVLHALTGAVLAEFTPFPSFLGGVRVATGDVNGDGVSDIIAGGGPGGGPRVRVFSGSGAELASFFAFDPTFLGGVSVAAGGTQRDGVSVPAVFAVPEMGGDPVVRVFTQPFPQTIVPASQQGGATITVGDVDGDELADLISGSRAGIPKIWITSNFRADAGGLPSSVNIPAPPNFTGGVFVAAGDLDGDGASEVVVSLSSGEPRVRIYGGQPLTERASFFAYDTSFTGGVRVATGDVSGDGIDDIIVGTGPGSAGGHVRVFDGPTLDPIQSLFPFQDTGYSGGVFVASGDLNFGGGNEIFVGQDETTAAAPRVRVFANQFGTPGMTMIADFFAFEDANFRGGARVGAGDVNGDGAADVIVGAGAGGGPRVRVFDGQTLGVLDSFFAYDPSFTGGVHVASVRLPTPPACDPDFNGDGNVDQDDIACLAQVVGGDTSCSTNDPDFNRDGNVDQDDVASLEQVVGGALCP